MKFEDMAFLFQCDNRNRGIIRMNFDEAALLWKCVTWTRGNILEIGRYHGGSTFIIQSASENQIGREISSVDLKADINPYIFSHLEFRTTLYTRDSKHPFPGPFGFALIDGAHTCEGVTSDVKVHWNSITDGALVAFHDAVPNEGQAYRESPNHCPGVRSITLKLVEGKFAGVWHTAGSMLVLTKLKNIPGDF